MKLNKGLEFILKSTKEAKLLNNLGNKICSKYTSTIYYMGCLDIRRNKNIMMIFLSEQKDGYITYVCNGLYGVGDFIFYTHKEINQINKTWVLNEKKETIDFQGWRMLCHKESVINEFVCPLLKAEMAYQKSLSELKSKQSQVEMLNEDLIEIKKRFS